MAESVGALIAVMPGIGQRAERLARSLKGEALTLHLAGYRRLTHPSEMGQLFKVIACGPANGTDLPGLDWH